MKYNILLSARSIKDWILTAEQNRALFKELKRAGLTSGDPEIRSGDVKDEKQIIIRAVDMEGMERLIGVLDESREIGSFKIWASSERHIDNSQAGIVAQSGLISKIRPLTCYGDNSNSLTPLPMNHQRTGFTMWNIGLKIHNQYAGEMLVGQWQAFYFNLFQEELTATFEPVFSGAKTNELLVTGLTRIEIFKILQKVDALENLGDFMLTSFNDRRRPEPKPKEENKPGWKIINVDDWVQAYGKFLDQVDAKKASIEKARREEDRY